VPTKENRHICTLCHRPNFSAWQLPVHDVKHSQFNAFTGQLRSLQAPAEGKFVWIEQGCST